MEVIILDTNVLIEILKNNQSTIEKVNTFTSAPVISSITAMELMYGARDKREASKLIKFIELFAIKHLDPNISDRALKLVIQYAKSHSLDIPDSLIAATALEHRYKLFTYNEKDFRFIDELVLT